MRKAAAIATLVAIAATVGWSTAAASHERHNFSNGCYRYCRGGTWSAGSVPGNVVCSGRASVNFCPVIAPGNGATPQDGRRVRATVAPPSRGGEFGADGQEVRRVPPPR